MRTARKVFVTVLLLILVFMILDFFGVFRIKAYGFSSLNPFPISFRSQVEQFVASRLDLESSENTLDWYYGKCGPVCNYTWEEPEPFEVAEPLEGKELYIFYIAQIHEQYYPDVDPYIAMAIMEFESNYNPDVYSKAGAVGLMQVIPKYHLRRAEKYGLNDIWDPYTNIICGMDLLNDLYHSYGSWERGLLGYNNSKSYVNWVLSKAETLRGGNYFGETTSQNTGGS